jgi:hypothetical protein
LACRVVASCAACEPPSAGHLSPTQPLVPARLAALMPVRVVRPKIRAGRVLGPGLRAGAWGGSSPPGGDGAAAWLAIMRTSPCNACWNWRAIGV